VTDLSSNVRHLRPAEAPVDEAAPEDEPGRDLAVPDEATLAIPEDEALVRWHESLPPARPIFAVVIVIRTARTMATHDHTRAAAKVAARQALYVPAGAGVIARRLWEAKTNSRYERMMRIAEASGNMEAIAEWEQRAELARQRRHQRHMAWIAAPFQLAKALGAAVATTVGGLLLLGTVIAVADHDPHQVGVPLMGVVHLVRDVAIVVGVVWGPLVLAAPWLVTAWLWQVGRRQGAMPAWLATSADDDDLVIDETTIARALEALRIPQITAYFKQGLPLQYLTPARKDGRGTHAIIRLPAGVTADRIARRRADLATGLHRRAQEVWPTTGAEAGILDLWAADKGALAEGAGPYPLLTEGAVNVFDGVPFGKTLRGEPLKAPIIGRNTMVGGMPDQGKSSVARIIMLGCALDPIAEMRIWVPDTNFDFEAFKPRCSRYVMGSETEHMQRICEDLEELVEEIQRRGQLLVEHQEEQVTRQLAARGVGMHPVVALLEEAHLAFGHPEFGKRIAAAAETGVRLGRKRAIHLIISTQATTGQSVPPGITINCANGIAFAVARHQENDALLGQGAYSAGHRATDLIPGTDKGNAVVKGFTGERSAVAQAYYVSPSRGQDQVTPIIKRSLAAISGRGTGIPGRGPGRSVKPRDLLEDLDAVLGDEPVPVADVPALLARHAPSWAPYRAMTGKALREVLVRQHGIKVPSTGNRYPLDPVVVREALALRSTRSS
jgi:S-DNA-T family DNA segregation ATPase FtsK/SpoIIIE